MYEILNPIFKIAQNSTLDSFLPLIIIRSQILFIVVKSFSLELTFNKLAFFACLSLEVNADAPAS